MGYVSVRLRYVIGGLVGSLYVGLARLEMGEPMV
jgi:hypothetical protein